MKKTLTNVLITFFVGLSFTIGGLSAIFFLANTTTMNCQRLPENGGSCTITTQKMLSKHNQTIEVNDLFKASVNKQGELRKTTFNIVLDTAKGEVDFLPSYIKQNDDLYTLKDKINNFIDVKEMKTLTVTKKQRLFAYIFGGAFIFIGLVFLTGSLITIITSKSRNLDNLSRIRQ